MERDQTQSLLDERFPHGVRVVVHDAGLVFNAARLMVISDTVISCGPRGWGRELQFKPAGVVENEDGSVTLVGATPKGYDAVLSQPPEAIWAALDQERTDLFNDELLADLRGS